tara:strand:- start:278 stop:1150 length:873 start_codon:yes stop_codon:yes gene_type:complete
MKRIIILIPIYNDWDSFEQLIIEINKKIDKIEGFVFHCIVINDASTEITPKLKKPKNFETLKILNMRKNKGHARCNAFGIRYINENENFDYLILMDGDGEDRPEEIKDLISKAKSNPNKSVVAKRIKRSEGFLFRFLYSFHKFITFIFTGKKINFGNFSCLTKNDVNLISSKVNLWSSFSGTIKKYIKNFKTVNSTRGVRYFGPSKMSLYNLVIHSFSIIAVFKYQVMIRSLSMIIILYYLKNYLSFFSYFFQISLLLFCFLIFLVSLREKKDELFNSQENLKEVQNILH